MTLLMLLIFMIAEISFAVSTATVKPAKNELCKRRLAVNGAELVIFLIMLLFPHIDLSFRFKGFAALLVIRLIVSAVSLLISRNNEKPVSRFSVISGAVGNTVLMSLALIPAFIFNDYQGRPVTGEYTIAQAEAILIDSSRTESFENDGSYREVPVHFYYPENTGIEKGSLPLVIFSHGAFGWYQSNTSTYMELASHGYVVASLDHPYHAMYTKDSSGKTVICDSTFMQDAMSIGNSELTGTSDEVFRTEQEWMALREADMNFVIDTLKKAADDDTYGDSWFFVNDGKDDVQTAISMINTDKIGLMGHSLGGATAVTVGRREDISAVIDIDGTMLGEEKDLVDGVIVMNEEPYPHPLLNIDHEEHHNDRALYREKNYIYPNNVIMDNAIDGQDVYFKGSGHMNFTDLPMFSPFLAKNLGIGSTDPAECIDKMNGLILSFFDAYLKDGGSFAPDESY